MSELGDTIRAAREARGLSQARLGEMIGYSAPAIGKIERGDVAAPNNWHRIADALGISHPEMERLMGATAIESDKLSKVPVAARRSVGFAPKIVSGKDLVGDKSLPVFAAAMGGDGHVIVTFDAIDYVKRPSVLENVKNAYAVYVVGESMIPAFRPGDLALVNPHLPPARAADVVLFHLPPVDEAECMIKHLVSFSDTMWKLEQFNEARVFDESRADWPVCHRVVGKYSAR